MARLKTKLPIKALLAIAFTLTFIQSKAQSNYSKYAVGASFGINTIFADLAIKKQTFGSTLSVHYFLNENASIGLDGQFGTLSGGDEVKDPSGRKFTNSYQALSFGTKISFGSVIGETDNNTVEALKLLYIGAGVGAIRNNLTTIVRANPKGEGIFNGDDKSVNLILPLCLGINVPVKNRYGDSILDITLAYQSNLTFGEGLDGYGDNGIKNINKHIDLFNTFSLGARFHIGTQSYW